MSRRVLDNEKQEEWRKRFPGPSRFPRSIEEPLAAWVKLCWPPKVFMRVEGNATDIVIRFPGSPRVLQPQMIRKIFATLDTKLEAVFSEVMWNAPEPGEDSVRSQLAHAGFTAFHETWKHVLWLLYGDHFYHRDYDEKFFRKLEQWMAFPKFKRGRQEKNEEEREWIMTRYEQLLAQCKRLHEAVAGAVDAEKRKGTPIGQIPEIVQRTVREQMYSMRGFPAILGGEAFEAIPYATKRVNPSWEKPETWKYKNLAIALLALERHQKYHTIERRLRLGKSRRPSV